MANASSSATSNRPVCAICQDEILPDANISKLNCNHDYHRDCLRPWLDANHDTCPLDRVRITSINGIATEHVEEKESHAHVHAIEVQNPLIEARALYQRSIRAIQNPSIHSADPVERQAAKVQSIFFSIFRPPHQ
jgi:hypothetical protein